MCIYLLTLGAMKVSRVNPYNMKLSMLCKHRGYWFAVIVVIL